MDYGANDHETMTEHADYDYFNKCEKGNLPMLCAPQCRPFAELL